MMNNNSQAIDDTDEIQLICFNLGYDVYGLDIMQVKEIIRYQTVKPMPKQQSFIDGVLSFRGMAVPVIDLRKRFDLQADINKRNKIIIARVDKRIVGLIVDDVTDMLSVPRHNIMPPPRMIQGTVSDYLDGVVDINGEIFFILDIGRVITPSEKDALGANSESC